MPDWDQAPEWAQYCAQDQDGSWAWFQNEPFLDGDAWDTVGMWMWVVDESMSWKDSLQTRP